MTAARRQALAALVAVALPLPLVVATRAQAAQPAAPSVRAAAAILIEPSTRDVVFARNAEQPRPIASTTKLMTALLTLERTKLSDVMTTVPYRAAPAESVAGLRGGERLSVADLLRALLLASANDAAATLAQRVGGSQRAFVRLMNRRAQELGLRHTHFANPIGLDQPGNHASAEDLVKLALILRRDPFFRRVTDLPRATLTTGARSRTVVNRNRLVDTVAVVNGVKTGHTSGAGYVLVGSATRNGITLISVVLGEPSEAARDADSLALLRFGLRSYRKATPVRAGQSFARIPLAHRDETVQLVATDAVTQVARRDDRFDLTVVGAPTQVDGAVPAGTRLATLRVRWRGRTVAEVPLTTRTPVEAASLLQRADDVIGRTLVLIVASIVGVASLQLVLLRRRAVRRRRHHAGRTGVA